MELDIWKGDWGLVSVDLDCLKVAAYTKFIGVPVKFVTKSNPFFTPNGSLPVFRDGKHVYSKFDEIVEYLKSQNYNVDAHLTAEEDANAKAYTKYLDQKLFPCLQYVWWIDEHNYTKTIRPWYTKAIPFPFNYYYPSQFQQKAKEMIDTLYGEFCEPQVIHRDIYELAEKCFEDLSTRLGDNEFFFGNRPSSMDATIFSYLALLLKMPQKNTTLQNKLRTHDNLVRFVSRISQRYFPGIHQEYAAINARKKADDAKVDGKSVIIHRSRDKLFAALFATLAMTGYAISNGLLQLNFNDEFRNSPEYNEIFDLDEDDNN